MIHRIKPILTDEYYRLITSGMIGKKTFNLNDYYYRLKCKYYFDSATTGLYFLLKSLNALDGDEIILSDYNCKSVLAPIAKLGLNPVFYDIDFDLKVKNEDILNLITKKTKFIIFPHLFGFNIEIENLVRYIKQNYPNITTIEDSAHSFCDFNNPSIGNIGDFTLLSIGIDKPVSYGKAGILICNTSKYLSILDIKYKSLKMMKVDYTYKYALNPIAIDKIFEGNCEKSIDFDFIRKFKIFPNLYSKNLYQKSNIYNIPETLINDFYSTCKIKLYALEIKNKILMKCTPHKYLRASDLQIYLLNNLSKGYIEYLNNLRSSNFKIIMEGIINKDCYRYSKIFPSIRYPLQVYDHCRRKKIIKYFNSKKIEINNYCWPNFLSDIVGKSKRHNSDSLQPKNVINIPTYFSSNDKNIDLIINKINDL